MKLVKAPQRPIYKLPKATLSKGGISSSINRSLLFFLKKKYQLSCNTYWSEIHLICTMESYKLLLKICKLWFCFTTGIVTITYICIP